jgi:hypothetical protein
MSGMFSAPLVCLRSKYEPGPGLGEKMNRAMRSE